MYTIRSACQSLGISPHRLRKWESRYDLAAASRRRTGRREYDPLTLARLSQMVERVRSGQAPGQAAAEIFAPRPSKRPWSEELTITAEKAARTFDFLKIKGLSQQYESKFGALTAFDTVWLPLIGRFAAGGDPRSHAAFRFLVNALTHLLTPAGDIRPPQFLVVPWPMGHPWKARLWGLALRRAGYPAWPVEGLAPDSLAILKKIWRPQAIIVVADSFPPAYARTETLNRFQKLIAPTPLLMVGVRRNCHGRPHPPIRLLDQHIASTALALQPFVPRGTMRMPFLPKKRLSLLHRARK